MASVQEYMAIPAIICLVILILSFWSIILAIVNCYAPNLGAIVAIIPIDEISFTFIIIPHLTVI